MAPATATSRESAASTPAAGSRSDGRGSLRERGIGSPRSFPVTPDYGEGRQMVRSRDDSDSCAWAHHACAGTRQRGGMEAKRRRSGPAARARRRTCADCRGAGAGRHRRRDHRQGAGPAGGGPGGDLGGALDARRPGAPALARRACQTARSTPATSRRPPISPGHGRPQPVRRKPTAYRRRTCASPSPTPTRSRRCGSRPWSLADDRGRRRRFTYRSVGGGRGRRAIESRRRIGRDDGERRRLQRPARLTGRATG